MNTLKKTMLAASIVLSMGANTAQAAVTDLSFNGVFVVFDGYDPTFSDAAHVVSNGSGLAGDPMTAMMHMDFSSGSGTAEIYGSPWFGSDWYARNVTMQAGPTGIVTSMKWDWGAYAATSCGVINCDIDVTVTLSLAPIDAMHFRVTTVDSNMPNGFFPGLQPTFNGVATVVPAAVPVPAASWLFGSSLLGLIGVARRKAA